MERGVLLPIVWPEVEMSVTTVPDTAACPAAVTLVTWKINWATVTTPVKGDVGDKLTKPEEPVAAINEPPGQLAGAMAESSVNCVGNVTVNCNNPSADEPTLTRTSTTKMEWRLCVEN